MNPYKGNYTCLLFRMPHYNLLRALIKTDPGFMNKHFKYSEFYEEPHYKDISSFDTSITFPYGRFSFNQNQFKKELKEYLYQLSENPILKQSFSSLDISNNDFVANENTSNKLDDWDLKLYVSNDILIQVYEKYFILIAGPWGGGYTWTYFKQPLTLNFIKNKVLVEEICRCQYCRDELSPEQKWNFETCQREGKNYRSIMCNSEHSQEIKQSLWDYLYKNALGLYKNNTDSSIKTASKSDSYPNIDNSMRFIQKFKDELDWVVVQYLHPISFTDEFLSKYRNYLIFHHYLTELHKGKVVYDVDCCVSDKMEITNGGIMSKANVASSSFYNRKGKSFQSWNTGNAIIDSSDIIAISESENVNWSSELLIKLKDYLSWHLLSKNEALPWSLELLIAFRDKWDFNALSSNNAIRWSAEAIEEFRHEVSANLLSSNINVDWNQIPSGFFYKGRLTLTGERGSWDWNEISNNPGINEEFIQTYHMEHRSHIVFADGREGSNWDYHDKKYNNTSLIRRDPKPSLSSNPGLIWTDSLIQTYIKKLDFWLIALRGKIDSNLVMKYAAFFNESREYSTHWKRNSDYPSEQIHNFSSGWQNLKKNINFHPTEEFFYFAKTYSTKIYKSSTYTTGPYDKKKRYLDPNVTSNFEEVSVYSIFK